MRRVPRRQVLRRLHRVQQGQHVPKMRNGRSNHEDVDRVHERHVLSGYREVLHRIVRDRVVIGEVRDEVYYAKVYLDHGRYEVDSRPSDAIALAVGAKAPIFVAEKLLQAATSETAAPVATTVTAFGITVQELTPELAQYFGVDIHSGVLVADLDPAAQNAGVNRGDILTGVNGSTIESAEAPSSFSTRPVNVVLPAPHAPSMAMTRPSRPR